MLLLALDTSTRQASIALCSEEALSGEYSWDVGNNHSVELLLQIQYLVESCKKTMQDIDGLAVATGPGSFNGTRVALATAKALAFALREPLVGVSTLDIIAAQQQHWSGPICAILEAGRTELYAASYLYEQASTESGEVSFHLQRLSDYLLLPPPQLCDFLRDHVGDWVGVPGERVLPPILFCGEITMDSRQALRMHLPEMSLFLSPFQATRHAATLAMLAFQRLREGKADDPLALEPRYIRRPSITTSTRKQPLLGV